MLVCRLVGGKVTYVHRRLWPALVRVSGRFPRKNLAKVHEKHTASGKHVCEDGLSRMGPPARFRGQQTRRKACAKGSWQMDIGLIGGIIGGAIGLAEALSVTNYSIKKRLGPL